VKATPAEIKKHLETLESVPRSLAGLTKGVEEHRLQARAGKDAWSANEVLAHLRACADVWGKSIEAMLAEDTPTLPDIHPRRWVKETDYLELSFSENCRAFRSQRERLLAALKKLAFDDWSRAALIGGRRHTVFTQARRMAKHETEHLAQIESLLK